MADIVSPPTCPPSAELDPVLGSKPTAHRLSLGREEAVPPLPASLSPTKADAVTTAPSVEGSVPLEKQLGLLSTTTLPPADNDKNDDPAESSFSAATTVGGSSSSSCVSVPTSPYFPSLSSANSSLDHQKNALSVESIPQQTIMKALASANRNQNPYNLSLAGMIAGQNSSEVRPESSSSRTLSAALSDLAYRNGTPSTPRFAALRSPCFFHQRFDDAVNIDKVLEEIKENEWMSHSRLMQTATGVREVSKQLQRRPIKRAVRNVMIVTKARDNQLVHYTKDLALWLMSTPRYGSDLGVNVYVDAKLRNSKRFGAAEMLEAEPRFQHLLKYWTPDLCWSQPEKFDLVLTLGGDGTVLFTSWLFQRVVPPILSFSLGSLGFLTNFEYDRFKEHLSGVMGDDGMRVNLRMRFTCTVYRDGAEGEMVEGEQFEVLNELVIDRGPSPYVSNLELYGDNELLTVVQADGCIFSTPTGSTAYSLSAGGSLVHPDIPAILLTPICPHTLSFRPMILSDSLLLRVSIPRSSRATAYCSFDGKGRVELKQGDHVTIAASQYPFPTVVRSDVEWFNSVSRTLRWNTRGATQKPWDGDSGKEEEAEWDIDTDSAFYGSEDSSISASPLRRQMSLLGM